VLAYDGAVKYLSTELHVALARIVERLNAALGAAAGAGWEWVDEQAPTAAGEMFPP
jgi:hypothetical protein